MMPRRRISVLLDAKGRSPSLSDFANVCDALRTCLKHVAQSIARKDVDFEVRDLRKGSVYVAVEASRNGVPENVLADIESTFIDTVDALQSGRPVDPRLDYQSVRAFSGFCSPIKRGVFLSVADVPLTQSYVANLDSLLAPEVPVMGSVTGRLEAISVHGGHEFTLYPPMPGEKIECNFDEKELAQVLKAVKHNVTVFGQLRYAKAKVFPVSVDVESFEVEPDNSQLPTLLEARGIMRHDAKSPPEAGAWRDGW